jgi:hypothetical protein
MSTFDGATFVFDTIATPPLTSNVVPRIAVVLGDGWKPGASFHARKNRSAASVMGAPWIRLGGTHRETIRK